MLEVIAPELWQVPCRQKLLPGVVFPHRMVVVRLSDRSLLLYSPIQIDDALAAELAALGPVQHLVAPSTYHHLYLGGAKRRYPAATSYAAAGVEKKNKSPIDRPLTDDAAANIDQSLAGFVVAGMPRLNECVFVHRPSKTLIVCDLVFNIHEAPTALTGAVTWLSGVHKQFGVSRIMQSMVDDVEPFVESMKAVLATGFERVVMCHGDIVPKNGAALLRGALESRFGLRFASNLAPS